MNKRLLIFRYITFDALAAVLVWILFMVFRKTVNDAKVFGEMQVFVPNYDFYTSLFLFPIACLFIYYLSGYYVNSMKDSRLAEFFVTLISSLIISVTIFFVLMIDDIVASYVYYYYSLLVLFGLLFTITYVFRIIVSASINRAFKKKKMTINTLVIGTGKNAQKIAFDIERTSRYNSLKGFIQTNDTENDVPAKNRLGDLKDLSNIILRENIEEVVVALDDSNEDKVFQIINSLLKFDVEIQFTPRLYEILTGSRIRINKFGINPLISISRPTMTNWELSVKRFLDVIVSFLALLISLPVLIFYGISIKRDTPGPVFYKQERIGLHGKKFYMYKLRTMYHNSERGKPRLSSPDDSRITPVGRILRKYRLDEIPQFWNILKGDMSLVGPRPERQYFIERIEKIAPYYCLIYKIRPGLTSWGPIKIGYSDSIEKMIERLNYDIMYMENMSLFNDMKILMFTVEIIFKGKGM